MKRTIYISILCAAILIGYQSVVFAQDQTVAMEQTSVQKIDYVLPYPGILPDHPLFFIKKIRDQVMEKLIADPVRKIEFYALQSDKGINMGIFLYAKSKDALAVETIRQAESSMKMAVALAADTTAQGKDVPEYIIERLSNALMKHEEVVTNAMTDDAKKSALAEILQEIRTTEESLKTMQ